MTSGTSDRTFVDRNVLIYAHDVDAGRKHEVAKGVLRHLWGERAGLLSTQVLQEFYVNVTRKIRKPRTKPEARSVLDTYAPWCVVNNSPPTCSAAARFDASITPVYTFNVVSTSITPGLGRGISVREVPCRSHLSAV